jgi:quinoprotein dehydrogenase-associated probable ABC transporter substrate-binding protein
MKSEPPKQNAWITEQCAKALAAALCAALLAPGPARAQTSDLVSQSSLRVCADPSNLPFSSTAGEGFENKIAGLLAAELDLPLSYEWFPMATGFVRKTLGENKCDAIIGYAQGHELVLNTNHYYTSSYVIIAPSDGELAGVTTLTDPRLKGRRIGVVAGTPPATHLARNGLIARSKGYKLTVDTRHESPNEEMLADLRDGTIDAALMWGPIAGPLVKSGGPGLTLTPLLNETLPPRLNYRITMGVRQGELVWKRKLNSLIRKNQDGIDAILTEYGVPLLDDMGKNLKETSP